MNSAIAVVGLACRFPDANSPEELWENVLAQRRSFRRIPEQRLDLRDYHSSDPALLDRTYCTEAAVLKDWEFDRLRFRISADTFRSADLSHWLALEVAAAALLDAGFPEARGLNRERTGVLVGNSLTGEFSRANGLRLRWPYVRRVVAAALQREGWPAERVHGFLQGLEQSYKAPFPPADADSLAGGLSNTIAGRICNHFDLSGGGYTVDGACASSLLAVAQACSAISAGDWDAAVVGGVDLSLDPFELVGFAKAGALAKEEMRVYDEESQGFWPGEGCGFAVLLRAGEAERRGLRVRAVLRGWGVSSDGAGGTTRPKEEGQLLAVQRAYQRAGFGIETVALFEGHGTGTAVGDATELRVLRRALQDGGPGDGAARIGSVKANVGHCKAAAGIAGLIKAVMAVERGVLPPTTGTENPHPELRAAGGRLEAAAAGKPWNGGGPRRAGVSAMGFGGINGHVVVEAPSGATSAAAERDLPLLRSHQDGELVLFAGQTPEDLRRRVAQVASYAARLSRGELADLAAALAADRESGPWRAALVATSPADLSSKLQLLLAKESDGAGSLWDAKAGCFAGKHQKAPRIGLLFSGQGCPPPLDGGLLRRRSERAEILWRAAWDPRYAGLAAAQRGPACIAAASLAAAGLLEDWGIRGELAVGHSLGELSALSWAGALDGAALIALVAERARILAEHAEQEGGMMSVAAPAAQVRAFLNGDPLVVAACNAPERTVLSGPLPALQSCAARLQAAGHATLELKVPHAFHSPLVAGAAEVFGAFLAGVRLQPLQRPLHSTVTGSALPAGVALGAHLQGQITQPVLFESAVRGASPGLDLWIEVGPASVLAGLAGSFVTTPCLATDAGGPSLLPLLRAAAAAYVLGAPLRRERLFAGRLIRPFALDWHPRFLANPCEQAPHGLAPAAVEIPSAAPTVEPRASVAAPRQTAALEMMRSMIAAQTELPVESIRPQDRLLADLHLNSITVAALAARAARALGLPAPAELTQFSGTTVSGLAAALDEIKQHGAGPIPENPSPPGIAGWVRSYAVPWVEEAVPPPPASPFPFHAPENSWSIFSASENSFTAALRQRLAAAGWQGQGNRRLIVLDYPEQNDAGFELLLQASRAVLVDPDSSCLLLVQRGPSAASFARSLSREAPSLAAVAVSLPADFPGAVEVVLREAAAATGFREVRYDHDGRRLVPIWRLLAAQAEDGELPLGTEDVLLVSGGGKGIAAECALELAARSGAAVLLLGRSDPGSDPELRENLCRFAAAGLRHRYLPADVTDGAAVARAVYQSEKELGLGPVTALLHGAGANAPRLLKDLRTEDVAATWAPKVAGLRHLLAAVDPQRLRLLIGFGSILSRIGMPGEADYALANERLRDLIENHGQSHPHCRCLAVEWSLWSGTGMGERLGRIDLLQRQGVDAISPEQGTAALLDLLRRRDAPASVIVTSRFGDSPRRAAADEALPLLRFLQHPRVHYPGVELVAEAELSPATDPYLEDHVLHGQRVLPLVLAMEALAQGAAALTGGESAPVFEELRVLRPVIVDPERGTRVRLVALAHDSRRVEIALRSAEDDYQTDRFHAWCTFGQDAAQCRAAAAEPRALPRKGEKLLLEAGPLYGSLWFQRRSFQRLSGYHLLAARECLAALTPPAREEWFRAYLPGRLVLGDPGARDAALHALQACVPHWRVLPRAVGRWWRAPGTQEARISFARARQRSAGAGSFLFDLEAWDEGGRLLESWEGIELAILEPLPLPQPWAQGLLVPYWERRAQELLGAQELQIAWGRRGQVAAGGWRRPDGRRGLPGARDVSVARAGGSQLIVAGAGRVGCDLVLESQGELLAHSGALSPEHLRLVKLLARENGESTARASARVWAALEALKKAGLPHHVPLLLRQREAGGWMVLGSGRISVATWAGSVAGEPEALVCSFLCAPGGAARNHSQSWQRTSTSTP